MAAPSELPTDLNEYCGYELVIISTLVAVLQIAAVGA